MPKKMKGIFITGTDTGVGKSVVTGALGRYLLETGVKVATQKWIQTGSAGDISSDLAMHLKIIGRPKSSISNYIKFSCPYSFKAAVSPHLASRREKREIKVDKIIEAFRQLSRKFDFVIVEGIGGALVPFNQKGLVIDIARRLNLPVLIVAQNKLGAINHTLLTIEALKRRKLKISGIIFNNCRKVDRLVAEDNPKIIEAISGERVLGILPWMKDRNRLYEKFVSIGDRICAEILKQAVG